MPSALPPTAVVCMLLGFYEQNRNGHRSIGHGGDTQWFHSDMHLFIDDGIGLFISMNSVGKDGAVGPIREHFADGFADRYLPPVNPPAVTKVDAKTAAEHAKMIAGTYVNSRRTDSRISTSPRSTWRRSMSTRTTCTATRSPSL